jgi:hypothetical protein
MIGKIVAATLAAAAVTVVVASAPDIRRYLKIRGM